MVEDVGAAVISERCACCGLRCLSRESGSRVLFDDGEIEDARGGWVEGSDGWVRWCLLAIIGR